jgi:hypothetical protein
MIIVRITILLRFSTFVTSSPRRPALQLCRFAEKFPLETVGGRD